MGEHIVFQPARELAKHIQTGELSVQEVVETHLEQIDQLNPKINAIINLNAEQAMEAAKKADQQLQAGESVGPFHGLPIAIKDTANAVGFPTTYGFVPFKNNMPKEDDILVERLKDAGAIIIGKTNVPEFAAGSHTFNNLFGTTKNPYDLTKTAGGSSGGAAAAVVTGMIPFADGSDMGGSLRNPGSYNNVVGFRPSPGRVPSYPKQALYSPLAVQGPIARDVKDTAFLMSVIAGPDVRSPLSIEEPGSIFLNSLDMNMKGKRIAWSTDLGGLIPVDPAVKKVVEDSAKVFENLGCLVEEAYPDLSDAEDIFQTFRALEMELSYATVYQYYKDHLKDTLIWNIEKGINLKATDINRAERKRHKLYHKIRQFFDTYDAFILPVSQVPPFDANIEYPTEINGKQMSTYIEWMQSAYFITVTGTPAISVPAGFSPDGLPIGLQIVGPHRADFDVLRIAYAFEQATKFSNIRPAILQE